MAITYTETRACVSWVTPVTWVTWVTWVTEDLLIDWWISNTIHTSVENLWYTWNMWEYQIYDLWLSI